MNIKTFVRRNARKITTEVVKQAPVILTTTAVGGVISTFLLTQKAAPVAKKVIDEAVVEYGRELNFVEKVQKTWKIYLPAVVSAGLSIGCIVAGHALSVKRQAALAAAVTIGQDRLQEYMEKTQELVGEKKSEEIRESIATDVLSKSEETLKDDEGHDFQVFNTGRGEQLVFDRLSGRYFRSTYDAVEGAFNHAKYLSVARGMVGLNAIYRKLGLPTTELSDHVHWRDDEEIRYSIDTVVASNGEACLVMDITPNVHQNPWG